MIEAVNISVRKQNKTLLEDVSFRVVPGKVTVVIGQNGAGKSTLLECLSGKNNLSKGHILWDGQAMKQLSMNELATRRAVLAQSHQLAFPIRVEELVEMGSYITTDPISSQKLEQLISHALAEVEMTAFRGRSFNSLSGGEQKRVLLAKCIVQLNCCHWADIDKYLLLDEPSASLDLQQQYKLVDLLKQFVRRRNIGLLAVLHDLNLAAYFADEILILQKGRQLAIGSPQEVLTPDILRQSMGIEALVGSHPVYDCLQITPYHLPNPVKKKLSKRSIQNSSEYDNHNQFKKKGGRIEVDRA
ncbi:MAG: heme ABC transporter ATP-binding protein [Bacteroidota bacterium]